MADSKAGSRDRTPLIIGVVVIAIAGGATIWHKLIREQVFPKRFGVVEEGQIYRSGQLTSRMLRHTVDDHNIKTIIDLSHKPGSEISENEQRIADELGVTRFTFSLRGDGRGDPQDYAEVLELMTDEANHPVLVHCAAGAQRTGVAVLLYRTIVEGQDFAEVYPETFNYGHKDDEWIMLAFIADNIEEIRAAYNEPNQATPERSDAETPVVGATTQAQHDDLEKEVTPDES